jgi:micrococcal nuclease
MKSKNIFSLVLGLFIILASILGFNFSNQENLNFQEVFLEEIVDGDTIKVKDIKGNIFKVRYLGIDTPEPEGLDYETCFYSQAEEKNRELISNEDILLEFDRDKYDRFGRTLAYVYTLDNKKEKETFVNLELLKGGYARFFLDNQNIMYQEKFIKSVTEAHDQFLGLWGSCGEEDFNKECVIKGNIGNLGDKHYHLPDDKYYSLTKVNLLKGDKWLCTVEEAESKGFERVE